MEDNVQTLALYLAWAPIAVLGLPESIRSTDDLTLSHQKVAVIGMLCAALGIDRSDTTSIASFADLSIKILWLSRISRWSDYHTVGGGYDLNNDKQHIPRTAEGKTRSNAVVSRREYLSDARFGVLLCGDGKLLERCDEALQDPSWGIWFGRKSCIPAAPVSQGIFDDHHDAVTRLIHCSSGRVYRTITDESDYDQVTDFLPDIPINYALRTFAVRQVTVDDVSD